MGAKFCTVKTELILLGLAAAFLGVLLGISAGDRAAAEPVSVSAERALPPEEIEVVLVDLNTAGADALCTLPGVGERRARAILEYREQHGPFEQVEDAANVPGLTEEIVASWEGQATVH